MSAINADVLWDNLIRSFAGNRRPSAGDALLSHADPCDPLAVVLCRRCGKPVTFDGWLCRFVCPTAC